MYFSVKLNMMVGPCSFKRLQRADEDTHSQAVVLKQLASVMGVSSPAGRVPGLKQDHFHLPLENALFTIFLLKHLAKICYRCECSHFRLSFDCVSQEA